MLFDPRRRLTVVSLCQSEGMEGDGGAEAQYAYYPATIAEATAGTMVTTVQASDTLLGQTAPAGKRWRPQTEARPAPAGASSPEPLCPTGQVYVMMPPQEVLAGSNQRTIAPRTQPYLA